MAGLLATADLTIAPGPLETFGLAALEAPACGTATVVSSSSALPAVIGDAGVAIAGEDLSSGVYELLGGPSRSGAPPHGLAPRASAGTRQ